MACTPGSLRVARSRNSYPSIAGMCTSTSPSRHWPVFTSRRASSGSEVVMASYPMSAITADSISSCAGSSSRMHGVSADLGVTISTDFVEAIATMPYYWATRLPSAHSLPHPCLEFRYDCLKSTTSWKLLRLLLGAGQKLPRAEALSAEPGSRCPILLPELHLLLHFGPEELPEFPFWYSSSGALQKNTIGDSRPDWSVCTIPTHVLTFFRSISGYFSSQSWAESGPPETVVDP